MKYELTDYVGLPSGRCLRESRVPRVDDRRILDGIFSVLRSCAPRRDLPETFGPYTTCYNPFVRWRTGGVWDFVMELSPVALPPGMTSRQRTISISPSSRPFEFCCVFMRPHPSSSVQKEAALAGAGRPTDPCPNQTAQNRGRIASKPKTSLRALRTER